MAATNSCKGPLRYRLRGSYAKTYLGFLAKLSWVVHLMFNDAICTSEICQVRDSSALGLGVLVYALE
jgi:hypothetical protein